jgi:transcriptional regulator with XRE-family HTH domain
MLTKKNTAGERLKELRRRMQWSQKKMAEILSCYGYKIKDAAISYYESDRSKMNTDVIDIICEIAQISPLWNP